MTCVLIGYGVYISVQVLSCSCEVPKAMIFYLNVRRRCDLVGNCTYGCLFAIGATAPQWAMTSFTRFLDHTQRRTTVGRTHLDELSARRRDLCLTPHNTLNKQTSMSPGGIRTHNLSRRAVADLRLIQRGHWSCTRMYSSTSSFPVTGSVWPRGFVEV